jgi:hypothetical protein
LVSEVVTDLYTPQLLQEMMARMDAWLTDMKENREETMACQVSMEACLECKEPASVEMKPEVADEEVPLEDAARMPVGEPRNRRRDRRHLAAQRRQKKEQKRTQSKNGCRKDLVAARRGTTRCAAVARRKKNIVRKSRIGNDIGGGVLRERTSGKRRRVDPEGNTGIKNPGARWQLRLRNEKTAGRISWKTHRVLYCEPYVCLCDV